MENYGACDTGGTDLLCQGDVELCPIVFEVAVAGEDKIASDSYASAETVSRPDTHPGRRSCSLGGEGRAGYGGREILRQADAGDGQAGPGICQQPFGRSEADQSVNRQGVAY